MEKNELQNILGGSLIFKRRETWKVAICKAGEIRSQSFTARARLIYSNKVKQNSKTDYD